MFRFTPILIGPEDRQRIHGTDERLPIAGFARSVAFFGRLLKGLDGL